MAAGPVDRLRVSAQKAMTEHPPRWRDANKRLVFEISSPAGCVHGGHIDYSRWAPMALPSQVDPRAAAARLVHRPGFYDYPPSVTRTVEWHVNFADPRLFGYYDGPLFAQDEMQVVEHAVLGALREALVARGMRAVTVEDGRPTPVLVMGVERRCRVATGPDRAAGRPHGLYGNAFAGASEAAIRRATTRIDPPTMTNLIAMAAPGGGRGEYAKDEIERVLVTAYTAFRAAVLESSRPREHGDARGAVVHTGWWGCGAFGGNRILMAALQLLAGEMAGVERLVFHLGSPATDGPLREAVGVLEAMEDNADTADVIARLVGGRFAWGVGNGT